MKPTHDWHFTLPGRVALFLGSIQLAVPVMILVAAALAWGTYLESIHDAKTSRASVYGAWWFITLMALICVSLVFAVITRYPWKRKHVGFITVHTGLVLLIVGGFWSLFGRVEGTIALEEGSSGDVLETDQEIIELAEFNAGQSTILGFAPAPRRPTSITLGAVPVQVVARWENTRQEQYVADDGPEPFRAIEVSLDPAATSGEWIGEESKAGGASTFGGMLIRVLADGASWQPPASSAPATPGFFFVVGDARYPLGEPQAEAFPGWTIVSVERFSHAMVAGGKLSEGSEDNPAVDVVITDGKGTTQRHTAFLNFPDMVMARNLEGAAASGAKLTSSSPTSNAQTLVVFGPASAPRFGSISADGAGRELPAPTPAPASFPAVIDIDNRKLAILNQFTRARPATRFVEAPAATERRPALVLASEGSAAPIVLPWKSYQPITSGGRNLLVRYGPRLVQLPFTVRLNDFRKMDYPGTDMAMAYESEVVITSPGVADVPFLIHMNSPFAHAPWKVYQSGFVGENLSVFSVMKDPGLPMTYAGSIVLCVGIFLTFFVRNLSWGHPGIPVAFSTKESSHASPAHVPPAAPPDRAPLPACAGV